jgi:hypothetical protein
MRDRYPSKYNFLQINVIPALVDVYLNSFSIEITVHLMLGYYLFDMGNSILDGYTSSLLM